MCDVISFAELDREYVELLPARTVLSMFSVQDPSGASSGGGLTPESLAQTAMKMVGLSTSSSGAGGSSDAGNGGG